MGKKLVIVESPAKSKTIGRYLGSDYIISASLGHIRDLPSGNLGVDVKNNFKPLYITMKGKEKVVRDLKLLAADADEILLATDPDREGEAIAWHLAKVLKIDPDSKCRITFNEITKSAVQEAIKNPGALLPWVKYHETSKTVVRPTYSYLGDFIIHEKVIKDIAQLVGKEIKGVNQVISVYENTEPDNLKMIVVLDMDREAAIWDTAMSFQKRFVAVVEEMTAFNVVAADIEIRRLT